jgi:Glycosyltransferase like family 2
MKPILTTITPVWNRADMLLVWLQNLLKRHHPQVQHILLFVEPRATPVWCSETPEHIKVVHIDEAPGKSIIHYHELGMQMAETEWVMKLDIDTLPNIRFFSELLPILETAAPREWFNVGMLYVNKLASLGYFNRDRLPVSESVYRDAMEHRNTISHSAWRLPAGTNFVCRTSDYLDAVNSNPGFKGYGWEDYFQIYQLEREWLQADPLPGHIDFNNVTQRCRDQISRIKAVELWKRNEWLCLLHHWHDTRPLNSDYRNPVQMDRNKRLLFDMIEETKQSILAAA